MRLLRSSYVAPALTMFCFALGTAFLVSGVIPKVFGEAAPVEAAAKQYTSEWKATRMLRVQWGGVACVVTGGFGCQAGRDIFYTPGNASYGDEQYFATDSLSGKSVAIGVAEWEVKGQVPTNGTYFKETWAIPGSRNLDVRFEKRDGNGGFYPGNTARKVTKVEPSTVSLKDFSIGIADMSVGVRLFTAGVPSSDPVGAGPRQFSNGATSCNGNNDGGGEMGPFCISTTGSYGWTRASVQSDINNIGNWPGRYSHFRGSGSAIPLKWTVTGYVCDQASDVQCR